MRVITSKLLKAAVMFALLVGGYALAQAGVSDLPNRTSEQADITIAGSKPFHLKARVIEATNPDNDEYKGEIEEYWVAPDKWRRTVKTENFSQTLVVNGDKTSQQSTGDYYPNWMHTLVSAIFEPSKKLKGLDLSRSSDNPVVGGQQFCRRFSYRTGAPGAENNVFSTFCFERGLIASIGMPGYHAEYRDYKQFGGKQIARRIREYLEPGTEVEATISELSEIKRVDDSLFAVQQTNAPLQTITVKEDVMRKLLPPGARVEWPPIRGGKTSGVLSIYVCAGRDGRVRETYALNSDNADMSDAARTQFQAWRLKPALAKDDEPVQVEGILTFAFETKIEDAYPVLVDDVARRQAIRFVEPQFPSSTTKGRRFTIRFFIGEDGIVRASMPGKLPPELVDPVIAVVREWRFRPYVQNGKATAFDADISFVVK